MPLTTSQIEAAAKRLGVEPCAIRAVVEVESAGAGFLPDGRPKVLFEGHIFWKELRKRGLDPEPHAAARPDLVCAKWTREHYRNGPGEWERLEAACKIHREAALSSASWGLFQIMGFNCRLCGFADAEAFARAMARDEAAQLEAFCEFLRNEGLALFLVGRDWAGFARRYNGPAFAQNKYDVKLTYAYERCRGGRK